jgi:hypothetical protein
MSRIKVIYDKIADNRGYFYEAAEVNELNYFIDPERENPDFKFSDLSKYEKDIEKINQWAKRLDKDLREKGIKEIVIKDPRILHLIPVYEKAFKNSYFVHIVRDGRDYSISENEEREFHRLEKIDNNKLLKLWNSTMEMVDKYRGKENFYEIRFEDLLDTPKRELEKLWKFLGLNEKIKFPHINKKKKARYLESEIGFKNLERIKWLNKFQYVK